MLSGYLSKKAYLDGVLFEGECFVLGSSRIGKGTVLGLGVIVGYPRYHKIKGLDGISLDLYDEVSDGSLIGDNCFVRSYSVIYEGVSISEGVKTGHHVLIREDTVIGEGTLIGSNTIVDGRVKIGRNVSIQSGNYIPPETVIGDNVFLGPFVVITNDRYPPSKRLVGVTIESGAVIGANSTLISGVCIGENSVVAAGSVVTRDVEPGSVVAGVPARKISTVEEFNRKKILYERGEIL